MVRQFLLAVTSSAIVFSQSYPKIEVSTVKLNKDGGGRGGMAVNPGRLIVRNTPMRTLIQNAYRVPAYTITGGPAWLSSERYDIEAKVEGELKGNAALQVLKSLLEERFQLKVHRESKEGPVYFLTVAKGRSKLLPSSCIVIDPAHMPPPPAPGEKTPDPCGRNRSTSNGGNRTMDVTGLKIDDPNATTVPGLTFYFSSLLQSPVIDKTGLTGTYDIHLEYADLAGDTNDPSIFAAVQEQLGLKLESAKGPVQVLVIDHVEKPSSN